MPQVRASFLEPRRLAQLRRASVRGIHIHRQLTDEQGPYPARDAGGLPQLHGTERSRPGQALPDRGPLEGRRLLHPGLDLRFPALGAERRHRSAGQPAHHLPDLCPVQRHRQRRQDRQALHLLRDAGPPRLQQGGQGDLLQGPDGRAVPPVLHREPGHRPEEDALHRGVVGGRR